MDRPTAPHVDRFLVLPSFVSVEEQAALASSALAAHRFHSSAENTTNATTSKTDDHVIEDGDCSESSKCLNLGLGYCGAPLLSLPTVVELSYRAFQYAASIYEEQLGSKIISNSLKKLVTCKLTGIALLYGPYAKMTPHFDSPTQPQQKEEWLVMFSIGNDVIFQVNDHRICLSSGDALVMDAMNVLHGVLGIVAVPLSSTIDRAVRLGFARGSRMGILLWQSSPDKKRTISMSPTLDDFDFDSLFGNENDEI